MSAAVMSNFIFPPWDPGHGTDSQARVNHWMLAQMAQYPPPPQPDQHHYNALYPASAGAQQLVDPHDQLPYSSLNQPVYPKVDATSPDPTTAANHNVHHLAHDLHQHGAFDDRQQAQHGNQQPLPHGQPVATPRPSQPPSQPGGPDSQKANRLRKACDSCSIRKVKVCHDRSRRSSILC